MTCAFEYKKILHNFSKVLLVGVFLTFPIFLALGNILAVLFLCTTLLAGDLRERFRQMRALPSTWPILLLFLWVLLGASYTSAPFDTVLLHLFKYAKLLVCLVVASVLMDEKTRRNCLYAFMAAMLFILMSVYVGVFVPLPWAVTQQTGWGIDHTVVGDYITQNVMMTFFVVACLAFLMKSKAPAARVVWGVLAVLGAVSITHLSWGRTGFFLLTVCLAISVLGVVPGKKKIWAVGGMLALIALIGLSSPLLMNKVELGFQEIKSSETNISSSIGHRLYNYKSSFALIEKAPFLGSGTGSFSTEACNLNARPEDCAVFGWHPHNQYLFFMIENGVLSGLMFVALLASLAYVARKRSTPDKFLMLGFVAALAADSLVNSPLFSARESHFFVLLMALLMAGPVIESPSETTAEKSQDPAPQSALS